VLHGALEYATDLFDAATIERWIGYFQRTLESMVTDEQQPVHVLNLMDEQQRHQVVVDFNHTPCDYPRERLVHQLFEEQAGRNPDKMAVVCEAQTVSYAELNRRANQVAHALQEMGVKPDDRVGLCLERSIEVVVGLLGIFKAGGAYVPLDPEYPQERLSYMLEDSAPVAIVTRERLLPGLCTTVPALLIDTDLARQPDSNTDIETLGLNAKHLAYVIYTSGSTGAPKGVMIEGGSLVEHILASVDRYGIGPQDKVLQFSSISFDPSIEQICCAFVTGATLVMRPSKIWSADEMVEALSQHGVTVANITPSYLNVVALGKRHSLPHLRLLIAGGEALSMELAARWDLDCVLMNAYGPTETTVTATTFRLQDLPSNGSGSLRYIPIGRSTGDTQIYVLDTRLQPVPPGVIGEIYIGGASVARGYLNLPALTAERFLPDPFRSKQGSRLYKTGDLGRWLVGGNVEFLGRNDHQVKIRGFRIELGEV
ncbi:amino acid adenylation domain-containing protein, partial [Janthinobacterium sp. BJB401]|uniref:non-ribosomal peptide synthetase n=1 Tax=Janthinobacterium sp. BJB401 TaxID=2745934 RepID=UPI0015954EBB